MWVKSHAPRGIGELGGNREVIARLSGWLDGWKKGGKAALIAGPPGTGKTLVAGLLAKERGLELVEMSAGDLRNKSGVDSVLGSAGKQATLFGRSGRLLLVDEVDSLGGRRDYGGMGAIVRLVRESSYPVILTANRALLSEPVEAATKLPEWKGDAKNKFQVFSYLRDVARARGAAPNDRLIWAVTYSTFAKVQKEGIGAALAALPAARGANWWEWDRRVAPLKGVCELFEFSPLGTEELASLLAKVAKKEGVSADAEVLREIAAKSGGDARAAITLLQAVSAGRRKLALPDIEAVEGRTRAGSVEKGVKLVLATTDPEIARRAYRESGSNPDEFSSYLGENLPGRYKGAELAAAYRSLADADIVAGRTIREGTQFLLPFRIDLMSAGVSAAKAARIPVEGKIVIPLSKFDAGALKSRRLLRSISAKVRKAFPHSRPKKMMFLLAILPELWEKLGLDEDERDFLGEKRKWKRKL